MGNIGLPGIVILVALFALLFGVKKIPELMENIGLGIKKFKDAQQDKPTEKKPPTDSSK
jgi:sec-independent protein translocase protein TatA